MKYIFAMLYLTVVFSLGRVLVWAFPVLNGKAFVYVPHWIQAAALEGEQRV